MSNDSSAPVHPIASEAELTSAWLSAALATPVRVRETHTVTEGHTQCVKLRCVAEPASGGDALSLFVKCFPTAPASDTPLLALHRRAMEIEIGFFQLQQAQGGSSEVLPTVYAAHESGVLVLEDVGANVRLLLTCMLSFCSH